MRRSEHNDSWRVQLMTDKPDTERSVDRSENLIPPVRAPFEDVLKSVVMPLEKTDAPPKS